jgi:hypothetical protein
MSEIADKHIEMFFGTTFFLFQMLKYLPKVHPKFVLKRKDLTKEHLNALDSSGSLFD